MKYILECNNLVKTYGQKSILNAASFKIKEGSIIGLVGPNGCGKTTLLKLILGLDKIDSGTIFFDNHNTIGNYNNFYKEVGFLIENPTFYPYLTGYQNLKLFSMDNNSINNVAKLLNMTKFLDIKVSKYSLGMKMKLAIARSIINNPKLLILDEPTNALDIDSIELLKEILKNKSKEGMTIIISSHNLNELETFCSDILILKEGKIIFKKIEDNCNIYQYIINVSMVKKLKSNKVKILDNNTLEFTGNKKEFSILIRKLVKLNIDIYEVIPLNKSLENIYNNVMENICID